MCYCDMVCAQQIFSSFCIVVFLLKCAIQTYAWGKKGSDSEVARLMKSADERFSIDENTTYAEVICCADI